MLFSNFTEKARIAISEAHDAAAEMGHNYIGSEHLLMGLIREGSGVAAKVLEKNGVTAEKVKDKINEYIGIGVSLPQQTELPLTPRSKRILEMSALEARRLNHSYIGTEHLLMAIIRDGDGVAAKILESLGVNLPNFYTDTVRSIEVCPKCGTKYRKDGHERSSILRHTGITAPVGNWCDGVTYTISESVCFKQSVQSPFSSTSI